MALNRAQLNVLHRSCLAAYALLLTLISLWTLLLSPPEVDNPAVIWAVQLFPLLLPVLGLCRGEPRSFVWLCFILLFYFSAGVVRLVGNPASIYAWLHAGLCLLLFISAMLFARWQAQQLKAQQ